MLAFWKNWLFENIASPYVLGLIAYALFLTAFFFPSGLYTSLMNEPDLIFLDPQALTFYTMSLGAFFCGVYVYGRLRSTDKNAMQRVMSARSPATVVIFPVAVSSAAMLVYLVLLAGKLNFLSLILSFQGDVLKESDNSFGAWDYVVGMQVAILLWAYCRAADLAMSPIERYFFKMWFYLGFSIAFIVTLVRVDRTDLMALLFGLYVVRTHIQVVKGKISMNRLVLVNLGTASAAIGLFSAFAFLRGFRSFNALSANILGYTLVSYNHLAALIHGLLTYPYGGKGIYLFPILSFNPTLNAIFHLNDYFGNPTRFGVFRSEFTGTLAAGLNSSYIWTGEFGYLFADLSWFTPVYVFLLGIFYGVIWRLFRLRRPMGLLVYPWLSACQLLWITYPFVFETKIALVFFLAVIFRIYETVFIRVKYLEEFNPEVIESGRSL